MSTLLYTPFVDYINISSYWFLLLIPLAVSIAVVYKALKVRNVRQLPAAAAALSVTILVGMIIAAGILYLIYWATTMLRG